MAKLSGDAVIFRFAYSLWKRLDAWVHLDPQSYLASHRELHGARRCFGLVPHKLYDLAQPDYARTA